MISGHSSQADRTQGVSPRPGDEPSQSRCSVAGADTFAEGKPIAGDTPPHDAATVVRRVVAQLERLEPSTARHLAGLAFILTRVADADHDISAEETQRIEEILNEYASLPEEQAVLVAEIARQRQRYADTACSYEVSRQVRAAATTEQRQSLLRYIFAVAIADGSLTSDERVAILQIASELGFDRAEVEAAQSRITGGHA